MPNEEKWVNVEFVGIYMLALAPTSYVIYGQNLYELESLIDGVLKFDYNNKTYEINIDKVSLKINNHMRSDDMYEKVVNMIEKGEVVNKIKDELIKIAKNEVLTKDAKERFEEMKTSKLNFIFGIKEEDFLK